MKLSLLCCIAAVGLGLTACSSDQTPSTAYQGRTNSEPVNMIPSPGTAVSTTTRAPVPGPVTEAPVGH